MLAKSAACLALLSAAAGLAQTSGFLLGIDYSESADFTLIGMDGRGAPYGMYCLNHPPSASCYVAKLSIDGKMILWQTALDFVSNALVGGVTVDGTGAVYVLFMNLAFVAPFTHNIFVAKLAADGGGVVWEAPVGLDAPQFYPMSIATDSAGRAYIGLAEIMGAGRMVRLNAAGTAVEYTSNLLGRPFSVAVDGSGSAFAVGAANETSPFLSRLSLDGSTRSDYPLPGGSFRALAVDPQGDAAVYGGPPNGEHVLLHFDATGALTFSKTIPGWGQVLAMDSARNIFLGTTDSSLVNSAKGSIATCGPDQSAVLSVFSSDGSVLQTTYLPGVIAWSGLIAAPDSSVLLTGAPDTTFVPTQTGPLPSVSEHPEALMRLVRNDNAPTFPLACLGSSATYYKGPIAPGEMVTLFGSGLGPEQGLATQASLETPFPTTAGGTEVTFDDKPAPLVWVQDRQLNVSVPWSVAGPTTDVCVYRNGTKANCLAWPVAQVAPGVFMADSEYAAALNADGTVNSAENPAQPGSTVSIFANGLGPISPAQGDGSLVGPPLPTNTLPVRVWDGCNDAPEIEPVYAGPAPYLVAGASQITFTPSSCYMYLDLQAPGAGVAGNHFKVYVSGP